MKVAAIQHDIVWEDPQKTFELIRPRIQAAADAGAQLVALAEMYSTGFSMASDRIAEPVDGPSTAFLVEQAALTGAWLCGSVPTRVADGLPVNRFVLAGPAGELHHYDKLHPFTYGGEHEAYQAGQSTITVDVAGVRVTPFVCYDLRFADDFWDRAEDTDLYVVVANWPAARSAHWTTLLRARAIENQAFVIGVNRVGDGNGIAYQGDSAIIGPFGELLAVARADEETLLADVDRQHLVDVRARYPFLRDRSSRSGERSPL